MPPPPPEPVAPRSELEELQLRADTVTDEVLQLSLLSLCLYSTKEESSSRHASFTS